MSFIKQCREVCVILVKLAIFIDILKKHPSILRCFTIGTKDASIPIRRSTSFLVVKTLKSLYTLMRPNLLTKEGPLKDKTDFISIYVLLCVAFLSRHSFDESTLSLHILSIQ